MMFDPQAVAIIIATSENIVRAAQEKCIFICPCGFVFEYPLNNEDIVKFESGVIEHSCAKCDKISELRCANSNHEVIHISAKE